MTIVVHCPKCQAKLRGPEGLAGRMVRCKGCQEKFRVPGGEPAASLSDSQHLSVIGSSLAIPAVPAKAVFVPAPVAPLGTPENPLPLGDLLLEEPSKPAIPRPNIDPLDAADLLEEPKTTSPADPFSFEEPLPEPVKKKKRRDDDDDRPRKRRRDEDDDEPSAKKGYQKKAGTPWGIILVVGVALLAIGGGVTALVMSGGKKEEAKAKVEPPAPVEPKPSKGKTKGKDANPDDGTPKPPDGPKPTIPPKKKEPPPKKEPPVPVPVVAKLPAPPTGNLAVVGPVKHRAAMDVPADAVRAVRAAGMSLTVAFNSQPGFQGAGVKDTIRQYSIATGVKGRQFEFDSGSFGWPRAFAVGGADGLAAVECGGAGKVSVFDFETGGTVLDKHDLFADTPGRVGPVAALAVGADRKLFVVDQAGTVDVWDLGTRTRVVVGTPPKRSPTATGKPAAKACAVSGGAAVAVALDGKVWAVNADGAVLGKAVTLPDPAAVVLAIGSGFGLDRTAVAYQLPGGKYGVAAVHPTGGNVEYHAVLPEGAGPPVEVSWPADTLLAVTTTGGDAGFIVDIEERAVTAYLKATAGKTLLFPTGGEFWWLAADATDAKKSALQSVEMPFDGYFDVAKKARADRAPAFLVPRPDGLAK